MTGHRGPLRSDADRSWRVVSAFAIE